MLGWSMDQINPLIHKWLRDGEKAYESKYANNDLEFLYGVGDDPDIDNVGDIPTTKPAEEAREDHILSLV